MTTEHEQKFTYHGWTNPLAQTTPGNKFAARLTAAHNQLELNVVHNAMCDEIDLLSGELERLIKAKAKAKATDTRMQLGREVLVGYEEDQYIADSKLIAKLERKVKIATLRQQLADLTRQGVAL